MEKNTVLLDLNEYNNLRDLKTAIDEDKNIVVETVYGYGSYGSYITNIKYITTNETIFLLRKEKEIMLKTEEELNGTIADLKIQTNSIEDIKKMSWWEFRKWKKK